MRAGCSWPLAMENRIENWKRILCQCMCIVTATVSAAFIAIMGHRHGLPSLFNDRVRNCLTVLLIVVLVGSVYFAIHVPFERRSVLALTLCLFFSPVIMLTIYASYIRKQELPRRLPNYLHRGEPPAVPPPIIPCTAELQYAT